MTLLLTSNTRTLLLAFLGVLASVFATQSLAAVGEPIRKPEIEALLNAHEQGNLDSFSTFLAEVRQSGAIDSLGPTIEQFQNAEPLSEADFVNLARLLGIYTRLRYKEDAMALLGEMVALQTDRQDGVAPHENPRIIAFGELVKAKASEFGLDYRNVDNRIFEVQLPGTSDDVFGILTHSDVVPAEKSRWVLEDGTQLDPYVMQVIGDKIYGRGTEDDKGSIVSALFAMKSVKDSGLPVQRTIRLMIETTEETGGEAFDYYKERNSLPDHNIVLDSRYPAVIAEKGPGYIDAYFPQREVSGEQSYISEIQGSLAGNQISSVATAIIRTIDPTGLKVRLDEQIAPFVAKHGGDFGIEVIAAEGEQEVGGDMATSDSPLSEVKIVVTGTSAHGSRPEEGVNPVPRLTLFLLESGVDLQDNHFLAAAKYVNEIFGLDYLGSNLGIAFSDDFMGPLTAAPTYFGLGEDGKLRVAANIRVPRGELTVAEVIQKAEAGLAEYRDRSGDEFDFSVKITDWMYRDPQGAWLETLLNVFGDTTGLEAKPIPTSGSTTAKQLPNAINFGPSMPGQKYMGHNANEFKFVENLYLDLQMFTEMMARIANLENLD